MHFFLATGLTEGPTDRDADERMDVAHFTDEEFAALIREGDVDVKTIAGLAPGRLEHRAPMADPLQDGAEADRLIARAIELVLDAVPEIPGQRPARRRGEPEGAAVGGDRGAARQRQAAARGGARRVRGASRRDARRARRAPQRAASGRGLSREAVSRRPHRDRQAAEASLAGRPKAARRQGRPGGGGGGAAPA